MSHQFPSVSDVPDAAGGLVEERKSIDWTLVVVGFAGGVTFAWVGLLSWVALRAITTLFG